MILSSLIQLEPPEPDKKEILRYAGCRAFDAEVAELADSCITELDKGLKCQVCYAEIPLTVIGETVITECFKIHSRDLAKNLYGCSTVVAFAASIGFEIDRLIKKYSVLSPSRAVMLQALGAERAEALCEVFCAYLSRERQLKPRFSPGYGDLDLSVQRDIFSLLDCNKKMGLSLGDSLLITPSKSVTAFVGVIK